MIKCKDRDGERGQGSSELWCPAAARAVCHSLTLTARAWEQVLWVTARWEMGKKGSREVWLLCSQTHGPEKGSLKPTRTARNWEQLICPDNGQNQREWEARGDLHPACKAPEWKSILMLLNRLEPINNKEKKNKTQNPPQKKKKEESRRAKRGEEEAAWPSDVEKTPQGHEKQLGPEAVQNRDKSHCVSLCCLVTHIQQPQPYPAASGSPRWAVAWFATQAGMESLTGRWKKSSFSCGEGPHPLALCMEGCGGWKGPLDGTGPSPAGNTSGSGAQQLEPAGSAPGVSEMPFWQGGKASCCSVISQDLCHLSLTSRYTG